MVRTCLVAACVCFLVISSALGRAAEQASAPSTFLKISQADCTQLLRHLVPSDADYRAGVDANGRPVVPADLPEASSINLPDAIALPIQINLGNRFGSGQDGRYEAVAYVGLVTLENGRLFYNGKPLADSDQTAMIDVCERAHGNRR